MRKLDNRDIDRILGKLGLHREADGSLLSEGKITAPKGFAFVGWLDDDAYMTVAEFREFLTIQLDLLEDEIDEILGDELK